MSFSSFYSVVNAIKDKSAEAMTTLSSDLQEFKSVVQEDVAELSKQMRPNRPDGSRPSAETCDSEEHGEIKMNEKAEAEEEAVGGTEAQSEDVQEVDPLTSLKKSLFSFGPLTAVSSSMQESLSSVQGSLTSVGSKLTSLTVGGSLESLEAMGSKFLNSADEFLGSLSGEAAYEDEQNVSESALAARRFRLLALQGDEKTYIEPPVDVEAFEKWKSEILAEDLAEVEKEVLENYPTVGKKVAELVPSAVGSDVFWTHYIYKASLLAAQEIRGANLVEQALNDEEEEIGWDADSPKAKDDDGKPIFLDDESKEGEETVPPMSVTNGPASSSDGESWIELNERKESTSSGASSNLKEPNGALADLKVDEGEEAAVVEDTLDWGDDDDLAVPEETVLDALSDKVADAVPATHEDTGKRGEDWGEWD
ncbi:unnamed protein product [Hyaloperonospora brassicae]|uniref:BSD domain-containing protein n=1 Tax=Hyaloperonospora brassicae TaxID=162125 RepID=A0AAV0TLG7_HYABA|nr:unnamed protein product [Hyaloperonospora brassicae]